MVYLVENKADLDRKIAEAGEKLIVIDFYATWCGPCKVISPRLEELAVQYSEHALVLKVNVDDNEEITVEYNVTSMPTFVFIKNSEVVEIFVGSNSDKLAKSMEKYVGSSETSRRISQEEEEEEELQEEQPQSDALLQERLPSHEDLRREQQEQQPQQIPLVVDTNAIEEPQPEQQQPEQLQQQEQQQQQEQPQQPTGNSNMPPENTRNPN